MTSIHQILKILRTHGDMCGLIIRDQQIKPIYHRIYHPLPYFIDDYRIFPTLWDPHCHPIGQN